MANPQLENGYTRISNEFLEALARIRIAGEARQMLDVIIRKTYGFGKKEDRISTSQFMEFTTLSRLAIPKARRKLIEMNLITVSQKGHTQILTYSIQKDYQKWKPYPKKDTISKKGYRVYTKKDTNCIPKGSIQKKERNYTKERKEEFVVIITHLNDLLKTTYKPTSSATQELIGARLEEGYTVDDFKTVHRKMANIWLNDEEMAKYLRPTTLYAKTKFEGYLNQIEPEHKPEFKKP